MLKKIALPFIVWRIGLFVAAFFSIYLFPSFAARFPYAGRVLEITHLPYWIWGFGNFDGVHYLKIAQDGYLAQYTQAFFPLFPILIRWFSSLLPKTAGLDLRIFTDPSFFYSGLILSNVFFFFALYFFYKTIALDYKKEIAFWSVILLLVFPTSFFFGAIYTESLLLFLTFWAIYLIRTKKFFWGAILISLATATRIIGVLLIPLYLIEVYKNRKSINYLWTLITPLGIGAYMLFLKLKLGNPFYFISSQPFFGTGRNANKLILLPQVIYRYIKIFISTKIISLPYFNAITEFLFTLVPLALLLAWFRKIRPSYLMFAVSALILGTLTGTFTSMPRYVLFSVIFLFPLLVSRFKKYVIIIAIASGILEILFTMFFIRGYWIA